MHPLARSLEPPLELSSLNPVLFSLWPPEFHVSTYVTRLAPTQTCVCQLYGEGPLLVQWFYSPSKMSWQLGWVFAP